MIIRSPTNMNPWHRMSEARGTNGQLSSDQAPQDSKAQPRLSKRDKTFDRTTATPALSLAAIHTTRSEDVAHLFGDSDAPSSNPDSPSRFIPSCFHHNAPYNANIIPK